MPTCIYDEVAQTSPTVVLAPPVSIPKAVHGHCLPNRLGSLSEEQLFSVGIPFLGCFGKS